MKPTPKLGPWEWNRLFVYKDGSLYWKKRKVPRAKGQSAGTLHHKKEGPAYKRVMVDGKYYKVHRVVWEMHNGRIPPGMLIDHIDGNGLNNRIENLRLADAKLNAANTATARAFEEWVNLPENQV